MFYSLNENERELLDENTRYNTENNKFFSLYKFMLSSDEKLLNWAIYRNPSV